MVSFKLLNWEHLIASTIISNLVKLHWYITSQCTQHKMKSRFSTLAVLHRLISLVNLVWNSRWQPLNITKCEHQYFILFLYLYFKQGFKLKRHYFLIRRIKGNRNPVAWWFRKNTWWWWLTKFGSSIVLISLRLKKQAGTW